MIRFPRRESKFSSVIPSPVTGKIGAALTGAATSFSLTDALNIFAFRPDLNLGAIIKE